MGLLFLFIFMVIAFGLTTLFRKWLDAPTLMAVAIGCACNANIYTNITNPIEMGFFTFSPQIVLYVLFMYTIMVRMLDYSYKQAKFMTFTSVGAIIISAVIELFALASTHGFSYNLLTSFSYYLFSSIGTLAGVWLMIWLTVFCRKIKVNKYLIIIFGILVSSAVYYFFYYGGISLINLDFGLYTIFDALGTIIGELVCIAAALVCYFINQKYWKPKIVLDNEKIDNK